MIQWNEEQKHFEMRVRSEEERVRYESAACTAEWVRQQLAWLEKDESEEVAKPEAKPTRVIPDPIRHEHRESHIVAEPALV